MIADIATGFIITLVGMYVWYRIHTTVDDISLYEPTDAVACQRTHQQIWTRKGEFPVVGENDEVSFIGIHACAVCLDNEGQPALRADLTERHKNPWTERV